MVNTHTSCYMLTVAQKPRPTLGYNTLGYLLIFLPFPHNCLSLGSVLLCEVLAPPPLGQLFLNISVFQNHFEGIIKSVDSPHMLSFKIFEGVVHEMGHLALIITDMQDFINFINKYSAAGIVTTFNVNIIAQCFFPVVSSPSLMTTG